MKPQAITAADELTLHLDAPHWRLSWGETDWLGPIASAIQTGQSTHEPSREQPTLRSFKGSDDLGGFHGVELANTSLPTIKLSARAYAQQPIIVFRIEAGAALSNLGNGSFGRPSVAWPAIHPTQRLANGVPAATRSYGHQYCEFALPVSGDENCAGFFLTPHRPAVVEPLLFIAPDGRTVLLAPLDNFHEQIIALPQDGAFDGVRCGWHGDLAEVAAGFATELAVWAAASPRQALEQWGALLQRRHGTQRPSRYADDLVGKLSYWTDNGAVYYYRTEPDCDYLTTLEHVVDDMHAREIPIREVHLDSFFYPHQYLREVGPQGAPIVPPSGMRTWEPRPDLFPDGFRYLRERVGLPLSFHSRHFWSESPYWEQYAAWSDGEYAHPADNRLYDMLMAQAASWGGITYEQDWLVESFLGVRGLRERPGRARAWQEAMDRAAREHGLTLQWCMATPADFMQTVTLPAVTSIRTSGDYRYMFDNGAGWVWFLHGNALARALGLNPFKDVFISHGKTSQSDGEPYAEIEALLAGMSGGPVGIGDQIGCSNREIIMRTCREDGVLIKPDVPLAAIDRCFRTNAFFESAPLIGETYSQHPAGRWQYIAIFNANRSQQPLPYRMQLADLGRLQPEAPVIVYDWRRRTWQQLEADGGWEGTLDFQDWDYRIVCPLLAGAITVFGDVGKYATVGDRRVAEIAATADGISFDVVGAPHTCVEIEGYAAAPPARITAWSPGNTRVLETQGNTGGESWNRDEQSGHWVAQVLLGVEGRVRVDVSTAIVTSARG